MSKSKHVLLHPVEGIIRRRLLVNYRADPEIIQRLLPPPFKPMLVHGFAIAGICLIRMEFMRPKSLPAWLGFSSEGAAHRIAVEWTESGLRREGVFVLRRDTSSLLNTWVGGRLFPGTHHLAKFGVINAGDDISLRVQSTDGKTRILLEAKTVDHPPSSSVFSSTAEASDFFKTGSVGYSSTGNTGEFDVLKLENLEWNLRPLTVKSVRSSVYDDRSLFPEKSICFDSAFLMQDIPHIWQPLPTYSCGCGLESASL